MPYADRSLPINHIQAPTDPPLTPDFTSAVFVGMIDNIARMKNGAAKIILTAEPEYVDEVMKLWTSNSIVSVNVAPWEPEFGDDEDDWEDG